MTSVQSNMTSHLYDSIIDSFREGVRQSQFSPTVTILLTAILVVILLRTSWGELLKYCEFSRGHDKFHQEKVDELRGKVLSFFSTPWSTKTYYLSDVASIKRLFMSNSSLHAHALAEKLHDMVWDVPAYPDMTGVDKMVHQSMAKGKLGNLIASFERYVQEDMKRYASLVGANGKPMPIHHMGFRMIYNTTVPAVMGRKYPLDATRIPNQALADSMQGLNLASMLPVLPRQFWNSVIPAARRGVQARNQVRDEIAKWEKNGGVAVSSDVYQNISKALDATKATPDVRARWINMVQFGFSGNTGESLGWILVFLLQSPKLLKEVMSEVDGLPEGSLVELPLRQLCPHLDSAIHETLRFVGSVFSGRMAMARVKLPGIDKTFEKGSIIRAMTRTATFDKTVWGEDAHHYRGNRFVGNPSLLNSLSVFGGGVSACPGRHFATHELQLIAAHVLRNFKFGPITFHEKCRAADPVDFIRKSVGSQAPTTEIIDLDGERVNIQFSGFDIDSGVEAISGLLVPRFEPVAHMTPVYL